MKITRQTALPKMGKYSRIPTIVCLLSLLFQSAFTPDKNAEYKQKAAFIYHFTQYFEWEDKSGDMTVEVLGPSPIFNHLTEIAKTKAGADPRFVVKQIQNLKEIGPCNFLFVPRDSSFPLKEILSKVPKGTLIITERPGFAAQGSAINFITINNKLKFESNLKAINAAGVKASSELLKLAITIE